MTKKKKILLASAMAVAIIAAVTVLFVLFSTKKNAVDENFTNYHMWSLDAIFEEINDGYAIVKIEEDTIVQKNYKDFNLDKGQLIKVTYTEHLLEESLEGGLIRTLNDAKVGEQATFYYHAVSTSFSVPDGEDYPQFESSGIFISSE